MLVDRGFMPENILLVSESAGAFAALALIRYLNELRNEHGVDAGMPGGSFMASVSPSLHIIIASPDSLKPACNMARFDHPPIETDYRLPYYRRRLTPRLAYHFPLDEIADSPYFNPAHALAGAHKGFPPTVLQFGDCEIFADDVRALVAGMERDGIQVKVDEVYGGLHCEGNFKRAFGKRSGCWKAMMDSVQEMGWTV
jgi:acetyl esterase/lipase